MHHTIYIHTLKYLFLLKYWIVSVFHSGRNILYTQGWLSLETTLGRKLLTLLTIFKEFKISINLVWAEGSWPDDTGRRRLFILQANNNRFKVTGIALKTFSRSYVAYTGVEYLSHANLNRCRSTELTFKKSLGR